MKIHPLSKLVEMKGLHWGAPSKRKACIALEVDDEEAAPNANKKKTMIQHLASHNIPACFTTHYLPIIEAQLVCYFDTLIFWHHILCLRYIYIIRAVPHVRKSRAWNHVSYFFWIYASPLVPANVATPTRPIVQPLRILCGSQQQAPRSIQVLQGPDQDSQFKPKKDFRQLWTQRNTHLR